MGYDNLDQLIGVYFNEDSDYWGDTIEELVRACASRCRPEMINAKLADIDRFKRDHAGNLDAALETEFGRQFDPRLWVTQRNLFLTSLSVF
ncbi:contact-dependent growth inhibition system immunity protein [Paraburkholderia sp. UCT70]|uniref:contact-dependent growth inhibition system immunity protein n=1 Tax=Paraburkholderia sp. UCT70 TaxID=2991068 RepID=UPI003D253EB8